MRIPISWLRSYLSGNLADAKIVTALERSGIEVEEYLLAKTLHPKLVVAVVKKVLPHPNAERLRLAKVNDGKVTFNVVCGAPNLAEGQKVILAKVGAVLPDGETIREASLRGELSQGMLCSEKELALGNDHNGILVLPADTRIGQPASKLFPAESVVDIKTAFNRYDVLTLIGLARETAAFAGVSMKLPKTDNIIIENGPKAEVEVDSKIVGRFMVAELAVKNDSSGLPQQSWLEATGSRSISPVVDVTNFVLWEDGQPLHAYDADKVKGHLRVRWAKPGEKLVTLDGVGRKLTAKDLVIADNMGPVGLAGVMGGQRTETSAKTKRVFLESATFDAATVRKMAQRHNLRSEASARFERGLPVQLAPVGLRAAISLMKAHKVVSKVIGVTDELRVWPWIQRIGLRRSHLNKVLGIELSFSEAIGALNKLDIPAERFDIVREAQKHLGKPYVWGASFKKNGIDAFDCSYLTDYLYSLIGRSIGHTAHEQFKNGLPVELSSLQPGDLLFRGGPWKKLDEKAREGVSHVALYLGKGKILHAVEIERNKKSEWQDREHKTVLVEPLDALSKDQQYLGARRYVEDLSDWISVPDVPWWRSDLKIEEDLIEEIVRMVGYDRIPATLPAWQPRKLIFDKRASRLWQLKSLLSSLGLFEVMTYSFVSEEQLERSHAPKDQHLKLQNPLSREQAYLRRSTLPSLLTAAGRNDRYAPRFGMYELSRVFVPQTDHAKLPDEPYRLSVLVKGQGEVYSQVKGVLDAIALNWDLDLQLKPRDKDLNFLDGRVAQVVLAKQVVGLIGELAPALVEGEKIRGRLGYLDIDLDALLLAAKVPHPQMPNRFPSITRDVNLVLKQEVTWSEVEKVIHETKLAQPEFLNDYYPDELAPDRKNLAVRLTISNPEKTLTDQEADRRLKELIAHLHRKLGVTQA